MCGPEIKPTSPSSSSSTPAPRSQVSPEIPTRYSPEVAKRIQGDTCFRCGQIGHWSYDCPNTKKPFSPNANNNNHDSPLNPPRIYCRCGHGFCLVKTSRSAKNPGRDYYVCPITRGKRCRGFIQFCDDPIDESFMRPPPYKYPECKCGAGVCEKVKDPLDHKYYFSCPVGKNHGTCGYRLSEDQLLDNKSIVPIQQSSQKRNDLGDRGDFPAEQTKRMRMMGSLESPLSTAVSELPERDDAATPPGVPEFEGADDDLQEVVTSVAWDDVEREALTCRSAPPRISCRQNLFPNHIFAGAVTGALFGHCLMGWLGRLLFIHPKQGLKFPRPQPFFCCIFPSFDLIVVPKPKQAITWDDPGERNQLAISNLNKPSQLSNSFHTDASRDAVGNAEVSGDVVSLSQISSLGGSQRRPKSKEERKRQAVLIVQQDLLNDLESLDPREHKSMRQFVEDAFSVLDGLSVDYKRFSDHVLDFINCASAVADIDKSIENSLNVEECDRRIEEERARLAQIQEDCVNAEASLEASNQQRQRLREEVSQLEAMLQEKQNQLNSCELESLKIENCLGDLKRRMVAADTTLKDRTVEAELARRLTEQREAKQRAAKAALEKAKLELENE